MSERKDALRGKKGCRLSKKRRRRGKSNQRRGPVKTELSKQGGEQSEESHIKGTKATSSASGSNVTEPAKVYAFASNAH